MEGCRFENQMDDGLNVHGFYAVVRGRPGARRLLLDWGHPMQRGVQLAREGDVLALMQANALRPAWQGRVRSVAEDKAGRMVVELETPPPLPEEGRWVAENLALSPEVTVKRCVFRGNRARGMLLTCRSALVEDCLFEVPGAAVYLEGEAEYWYESGATRELVFKNNRFVNCSYIPAWGAVSSSLASEGGAFRRLVLPPPHRAGGKFLFLFRRTDFAAPPDAGDLYDGQPISRHARLPAPEGNALRRRGLRLSAGIPRLPDAGEGRKHKRGEDAGARVPRVR